jgi:hypothetical protein
MSKNVYKLDKFLSNLHEWVRQYEIDGTPGNFSYKPIDKTKSKPIRLSLYGTTDMVFSLFITNELENHFKDFYEEKRDMWIKSIQNFQNPKTGWFKQGLWNYDNLHFKEHRTAFATSALKLLGGSPKYKLRLSKKLNNKKSVEKWLKGTEWGLLFWPGSHRGGGVGAYYATSGDLPHKDFFKWYFDWLDKEADPEVGFWRRGWIHKINKNRLTKNELGGAIHFYWVYEFMDRPIPFPEKVIDSTLAIQNEFGLWDKDVSYCVDLDGIFCLTRCCKQANGYKKEDIKEAIIKYLDYTVPTLNDRDFLFSRYKTSHILTGVLEAIAEVQKFYPDLIKTPKPWRESLDITPWI